MQLTRAGLIISDGSEIAELQKEFSLNHCVVLKSFLGQDILDYLDKKLHQAQFALRSDYGKSGEEFARELAVNGEDLSVHFMRMLLNNQLLFHYLETLTTCSKISNFQGRIYQMQANAGHYDSWHGDNDGNRLLGLSINLGTEQYEGGVFQLAERNTERLCCEITHTQPGNAHLFRISPELEHRVTPITGKSKRLVIAGWFQAGPTMLEQLKEESSAKLS